MTKESYSFVIQLSGYFCQNLTVVRMWLEKERIVSLKIYEFPKPVNINF